MKAALPALVRIALLLAVILVGWSTRAEANEEGCKFCLRVNGNAASCENSRMGTSAPALDICGTYSATHCSYICMGNCCTGPFGGGEEVAGEEAGGGS